MLECVVNVSEGRRIVDVVAKNKVIFQTGSQQRSEFSNRFRDAVEHVRNGRIGKVKTVRIGVGAPNRPCNLGNEATPDGIDWEMWNGPSPARAFHHDLCPLAIHNHFPAFRLYREYASGMLGDLLPEVAAMVKPRDSKAPMSGVPT